MTNMQAHIMTDKEFEQLVRQLFPDDKDLKVIVDLDGVSVWCTDDNGDTADVPFHDAVAKRLGLNNGIIESMTNNCVLILGEKAMPYRTDLVVPYDMDTDAFTIPILHADPSLDIEDAIRSAVHEYVNTTAKGFEEWKSSCEDFNYGDLAISQIPDCITERHGFRILREDDGKKYLLVEHDTVLCDTDGFFDDNFEKLKKELFMRGQDALSDFAGTTNLPSDKDAIEDVLDQTYEQMPDDQLLTFFKKYGVIA